MSTFMFIDALRPEGKKSEMAKEVAIIAKAELTSRIAVIDCEITKVTQLGNSQAAQVGRDASKHFKKVLGDLSGYNLGNIIDAYKNVKNTTAAQAETEAKLANLQAEKALLQELFAMYPSDVETISVEEEKA